jgi:hypothetical protein
LSKNRGIYFSIVLAILMFACVIPAGIPKETVGIPTNIAVSKPQILPTVLSVTPTKLPTILPKCSIENMGDKVLATVDASPEGLRLRLSPNGAEIAIIPHKSNVFVLVDDAEWSYVGWVSPNGLMCGFSGTSYLIFQE